jgi:hypothetical protein
MKEFEKEISWVVWEYDENSPEKTVQKNRTKTATFKELNRTDKAQHKLHFRLISLFEGLDKGKEDPDSIGISSDGLYDITTQAVKILLIENEAFSKIDKDEFLQDSIALLSFGLWLFKEKFTPFFSQFNAN